MSAQAGVTSPANTGQRTLKRRNETTWRSEAKAEPHHRVERRSQAHERRMNPDHEGNDVRVERARRVKPQRTRAGGNTRAKKRRRSEANAARNFPVRKHGTRRPVKNHRGEDPGGAKRQESSDRRRRVIPMSAARTAAMRAPTRLRPPVASRLRSGNALGRNNEVREVSREVRPATQQGKLWRRNPMGGSSMKQGCKVQGGTKRREVAKT